MTASSSRTQVNCIRFFLYSPADPGVSLQVTAGVPEDCLYRGWRALGFYWGRPGKNETLLSTALYTINM